MKIKSININNLRNDEHFQLHTELRKLVEKHGAAALNIEAAFAAYLPLYAAVDEALTKVSKSALTADIHAADKRRDALFRGMVNANKSAADHFKPDVQAAAKRLKVLLDTYGNLAQKPLNEETAALHNLLQELEGSYAADAKLAGLADWAAELKAANAAFGKLVTDRYEEAALKTDLVLKQCRREADEAYRAIAERVNALAVVEGVAKYEDFIRQLNAVLEKYATLLAQRRGRGAKEAEKQEQVANQ